MNHKFLKIVLIIIVLTPIMLLSSEQQNAKNLPNRNKLKHILMKLYYKNKAQKLEKEFSSLNHAAKFRVYAALRLNTIKNLKAELSTSENMQKKLADENKLLESCLEERRMRHEGLLQQMKEVSRIATENTDALKAVRTELCRLDEILRAKDATITHLTAQLNEKDKAHKHLMAQLAAHHRQFEPVLVQKQPAQSGSKKSE